MNQPDVLENNRRMSSVFERYLTLWVGLCIIGGIMLGRLAPGLAQSLDGMPRSWLRARRLRRRV